MDREKACELEGQTSINVPLDQPVGVTHTQMALPIVAALFVEWLGGLLVLGYGASQALIAGSWQLLIPWCVAAFVWFKGFGWASSTGSGLARAMQNA